MDDKRERFVKITKETRFERFMLRVVLLFVSFSPFVLLTIVLLFVVGGAVSLLHAVFGIGEVGAGLSDSEVMMWGFAGIVIALLLLILRTLVKLWDKVEAISLEQQVRVDSAVKQVTEAIYDGTRIAGGPRVSKAYNDLRDGEILRDAFEDPVKQRDPEPGAGQ